MKFYFYLLRQNWRNKTSETVLTILGLSISVAVTAFFIALVFGLRLVMLQQISGTPLTQIDIRPLKTEIGPLATTPKIDQEKIQQIENIPHITSIIPSLQIASISSIRLDFLGNAFQSDALVFGAPYQMIAKSGVKPETWQNTTSEPYPAIISSKLLDLYNLTAAGQGPLPNIKKEMLIGMPITILPGQSTIKSGTNANLPPIKAKLAGFSTQVQLLGITLPETVVQEYNKEHFQITPAANSYSSVQVEIDSPENYPTIKEELRKINLTTSSVLDNQDSINQFFLILSAIFSIIIITALTLSGLIITISTLTKISARTKEIGLLRAMGASQKNIKQLFIFEASVIGFISGVSSLLIAFAFSRLIDFILINYLIPPSQKPESIFQFSPSLAIFTILFSITFSIIFSVLPAAKASKMDPIEAVNRL